MSLRIQKSWEQLGKPQQPGDHMARGVGKIVDITPEHLDRVAHLGGNAVVVLGHRDAPGMTPHWEIIAINEAQ